MEIDLGAVALKSGEKAHLCQLIAPEPGWAERILPFLGHKHPLTRQVMAQALQEGLPDLTMNFFECVLEGEIVGNITTVEALQRPIGILQHVFTNPTHRRKGICQALMQVLCDDFQEREGGAMYLGTGFETPPFWIYHSFGFRPIGRTGAMRWLPEENFDARYFAPGSVGVRDTLWSDWPALEALYLGLDGWYLRGFFYRQYGHSSYEGTYPALREASDKGIVSDIKVLSKGEGEAMGHAFVATQAQWRGEPYVVDFFVHPNFYADGADLLSCLNMPEDRKVQCYADSEAAERCQILEQAGFQREATLRRQIKREGQWLDVHVYAR